MIQIQDKKISLLEARNNKLPFVEYEECRKILEKNGDIFRNDNIYSLNIFTKSEVASDTIYQNKEMNSKIVNSNGSILNTEKCDSFKTKFPINTNIANVTKYEEILDKFNYSIFNSSDKMFEDVCKPLPYDNNTDLTLNSRRSIFNSTINCPSDSEFKGFDEHQYFICKSKQPPKSFISSLKISVFGPLRNGNFRLIKCIKTLIEDDIKHNYAFYLFITLSSICLIFNTIYLFTFKLERNFENVFKNDAITLNPEKIGNAKPMKIAQTKTYDLKLETEMQDINKNTKFKHIHKNSDNILSLNIRVGDRKNTLSNENSINISNIEVQNSSKNFDYNQVNQVNPININNMVTSSNMIVSQRQNTQILQKEDDKNQEEVKNYDELDLKINTKPDLNNIPLALLVKFDKRNLLSYFWDEMISRITILNLVFVTSILNPFYIRLNKFILQINLDFCINAMFLTVSIIDRQSLEKNSTENNKISFSWMIFNQFFQIMYSILIPFVIISLLNLLIFITSQTREEFNKKYIEDSNESKLEAV